MSKYVSLDNLTRYDGKIKDYIGTATASFITKSVNDLTNYYLKSETYTKSEVNNLISAISTIDIVVVQTLPTEDISTSTIYLVPKSTAQTNNTYDEYIYVSDGASPPTYSWEKIGDTEIDLSDYVTDTDLTTALSYYTDTTALTSLLAGKQDEIDSSHKLSADLVDDSNTTNKFFSGNYNDLSNKPTIPTKTSDLTNDSNFITGMTILAYGKSTWNDFITAYNANKVVYCRASSNSNPASGSQTRMAFMAYVSNETTPTNVEFQYYRSVSSHSASQQGDQVYVYKLTSAGTWSVTIREAYTKIVAGTGLSSSYNTANGTLTLSSPNNTTYIINIRDDSGSISEYNTEANKTVFQQIYDNIATINAANVYLYSSINRKYIKVDTIEKTVNNEIKLTYQGDLRIGGYSGAYGIKYETYKIATLTSKFTNNVAGDITYSDNNLSMLKTTDGVSYPLGIENTMEYTPTGNYNPATKKYVDDSITASAIQYSTMPAASSTTVGKIVQYIGTTDSTYTNGYFYIGTTDGESTPTYSWEQIDVQPSSSGGSEYPVISLGTVGTEMNDPIILDTLDSGYYLVNIPASKNRVYFKITETNESLQYMQAYMGVAFSSSTNGFMFYLPKKIASDLTTYTDGDILVESEDFVIQTSNTQATTEYYGRAGIRRQRLEYKSNEPSKLKRSIGITYANVGLDLLDYDQEITGTKTFTALPESSVVPTTSDQLVNKAYVDDSMLYLNATVLTSSGPYILDEMDPGNYFFKANSTDHIDIKLSSSYSSTERISVDFTGLTGFYLYIPKAIVVEDLEGGDTLFYVRGNARSSHFTEYNESIMDVITTFIYDTSRSSKIAIDDNNRRAIFYGDGVSKTSQTWSGVKTFSSLPVCSSAPTSDNQLTNKAYVDSKSVQYDTMPTADSSSLGKIVQYTGATTSNFVKGQFYVCISDGASTPTYSWTETPKNYTPYRQLALASNSSSNPIIFEDLEPGHYIIYPSSGSYIYYKVFSTDSGSSSTTNIPLTINIPKKIDPLVGENNEVFMYQEWRTGSGSLTEWYKVFYYDSSSSSGYASTQKSRALGNLLTSSSQTISGTKTFSSLPVCSVTPTSNNQLVNKKYVDGVVGDIQTALATIIDGSSS